MAQTHQSTTSVRLICSLVILTLALISLILLRIHQSFFWIYTALMSAVIALISVGQGVYLSFKEKNNPKRTLFNQVFYWVGGLGAVYVCELMLQYGVTNSVQSGLFALLILAIVLYLNGISENLPLALVGVTLALMVVGTIVIRPYFLLVIIPVTVVMGILIALLIRKKRNT